jgi:hypothetical protein
MDGQPVSDDDEWMYLGETGTFEYVLRPTPTAIGKDAANFTRLLLFCGNNVS